MAAGRKPKPTHLKLVTGNPGKRKLNTAEAKPKKALPPPPDALDDFAKHEWTRTAADLNKLGLLTTLDHAALAAYCQAYSTFVQARAAIKRMAALDPVTHGLMIKTSNGNAIQNPLVGTANKAANDMVRFAAEFGMTPSARSRIAAGAAAREDEDPAAEFFD